MRHVLSLILLSAGSLASLVDPVASRADSIPTVTATSVTYSHRFGVNSWSISGDTFGVRGGGATLSIGGFATAGQILNNSDLNFPFAETFGGHSYTTGGLTLNGVGYPVELFDTPSFVFSSDSIYQPGITGSPFDPNRPPTIGNEPGTVTTVAMVPVTVRSDSYGSYLSEIVSCPPGQGGFGPCLGNALANFSVDLPGYLVLRGYRDPNDAFDTITQADFSAIPEPATVGLAAIGLLMVVISTMAFFKKSRPATLP